MKTTMVLPLEDSTENNHAEIVTRHNSRLKIKYCAGTNLAGTPCKAPAPNWSRYCKAHREKIAEPIKTATGRDIITALKLHTETEKITAHYEQRLADLVQRLARIILENVTAHRDRDAVADHLLELYGGDPADQKNFSIGVATRPILKSKLEVNTVPILKEMERGNGGDGNGNSDGIPSSSKISTISTSPIIDNKDNLSLSPLPPSSSLPPAPGVPVLKDIPTSTSETSVQSAPQGDAHA